MPPWLYMWLFRFARGERLRKAGPADYRLWLGILFLFPVYLAIGGWLLKDLNSTTTVWLVLTVFGCISVFVGWLWAKHVPAIISLTLAVIAWTIFGWWMLHRS